MDAFKVATLVLLALLVGAALPVLIQARSSLRGGARAMEDAGRRLVRTLDDLTPIIARVDKEIGALTGGGERIASLLASVDELARSAQQLRHSVKVASAVGAAVGPAVAAAVRAMRTPAAASPPNGERHSTSDDTTRSRDQRATAGENNHETA
jgi:hypothetical protein